MFSTRSPVVPFAVLLALWGCDHTVGLDPTRPTFTKLLVPGACKVNDNLERLRLSVMMLDGTSAIEPDARLQRQTRSVEEELSVDDFQFARPPTIELETEKEVIAEGDAEGVIAGLGVQASAIEFKYSGGRSRHDREDERLVVLLVDHSGSLIGDDPRNDGAPELDKASDKNDQRISFLQQLVRSLPEDDWISLISFSGDFPVLDGNLAAPTKNRDLILDGDGDSELPSLQRLQFDEEGFTPLADTLEAAYTRVIAANGDLNPVVVLFTDIAFTEEDPDVSSVVNDPEGVLTALQVITRKYASYQCPTCETPQGIPVIVLHLQQNTLSGLPRGRNQQLVDLACQTAGEYIFLERADELTQSQNLQSIVRNRLVGTWQLELQTTFPSAEFPVDGYLLSTEISLELGGNRQPAPLTVSRDGQDFKDSRLWVYKQ